MTAPAPVPYTLHVPQATLDDLAERLSRTRWPDEPPLEPWSSGTSVDYLKGLAAYWQDGFDWRAEEARLNALRQFTLPLAGLEQLHFIHEPGVGPAPMPLLLSHGWPGSVFEFLEVIPMLTDPARHGGDAADAFSVVAPSLPGYALSFTPGQPRLGVEAIAQVFRTLMVDVLGYTRFGAQGGDWGAFITSLLGLHWPGNVAGIHLNLLALRRDLPARDAPNEAERRYAEELQQWLREETGYQAIQGTKPQTLAFGLNDSPAGLAAWIVEKFRSWSDCDGNPERAISRDRMLADITLYWATGSIGASFWPYYDRLHAPWPIPKGRTIDVPVGYAAFPHEIIRPPRSLAERTYVDIRRWTEMPAGGHFAALEKPIELVHEIREFFRPLRRTA